MGIHDEAKLDSKFMEFAKLMNIHINHFPRHEKYGLALEIRRAASVLGHARHTHSLQHMLRYSKENHNANHHLLPKIYKYRDYTHLAHVR